VALIYCSCNPPVKCLSIILHCIYLQLSAREAESSDSLVHTSRTLHDPYMEGYVPCTTMSEVRTLTQHCSPCASVYDLADPYMGVNDFGTFRDGLRRIESEDTISHARPPKLQNSFHFHSAPECRYADMVSRRVFSTHLATTPPASLSQRIQRHRLVQMSTFPDLGCCNISVRPSNTHTLNERSMSS
jgi:hypothetical protein